MSRLLHPALMQSIPLIGDRATRALDQRIAETLTDNPINDPNITVAIRTFNEAPKLELLLQDVAQQVVGCEVEIVVIDNESTDFTKAVAKEYDAVLITLPQGEFTYPKSMNLGMQAASHDTVFLTVAHALLSSTHTLHAGARHFKSNNAVTGAFSIELPSFNASWTTRIWNAVEALDLFRAPRRIKKVGMGVMAATGAIFSRAAWQELGHFDERYETGGEDTAMARSMLKAGFDIVKEPAMAVHHSHGLGPHAYARELVHHAKTVRGPQPLHGELKIRRQARFTGEPS